MQYNPAISIPQMRPSHFIGPSPTIIMSRSAVIASLFLRDEIMTSISAILTPTLLSTNARCFRHPRLQGIFHLFCLPLYLLLFLSLVPIKSLKFRLLVHLCHKDSMILRWATTDRGRPLICWRLSILRKLAFLPIFRHRRPYNQHVRTNGLWMSMRQAISE